MKNFVKIINYANNTFIDLVEDNLLFQENHVKSINLWGKGNHAENKLNYLGHKTHIEKLIKVFGENDFNNDNYLEIGCGEGIDLKYVVEHFNKNHIYAVDLGANIKKLSERKDFKTVNFIRCDCLNLPFLDECFNQIYKCVFHHTKNFIKLYLKQNEYLKMGS